MGAEQSTATDCSRQDDDWADKPIPEDDRIAACHPTKSGNHDFYMEAMRLVGAKRSKMALVNLVNWLLHEESKASLSAIRRSSGAYCETFDGPAAAGEASSSNIRGAMACGALTTYVPLTEERIEELRTEIKGATTNLWIESTVRDRWHGELDVLCNMAESALRYAQEINRLRNQKVRCPSCGWTCEEPDREEC